LPAIWLNVVPPKEEETLSPKLAKRRTAAVLAAVALVALGVGAGVERLVFGDPAAARPAAGASAAPLAATGAAPGQGPAASDAGRTRLPLPPGTPAPPRALRADSAKETGSAGGSETEGASSTVTSAEDEVIRLTNAERAKSGCPALRTDERLRTAARRHSGDMAAKNYFSHTAPNGSTFVERSRAAGYSSPGAENIARGQPTAAAVVAGWMNSEGHRANILNCTLKAIGAGVRFGPGGPWWTQVFGRV
jgi:uncharacterized protein YkwD